MAGIDYRGPEWVAEQLGIDKNTVYKHLQDGTIPALQLGRKWLISEARLLEWMQGEMQKQTEVRRSAAAAAESVVRRMVNYSPDARRVIREAHAEARRYCHDRLGQGHLLLAMAADTECSGARIMTAFGVAVPELRGMFESRRPQGDSAPRRRLARSPGARKAMRIAAMEARKLGSGHVNTAHLLLGILGSGEGTGFEMLTEAGMAFEPARKKIAEGG